MDRFYLGSRIKQVRKAQSLTQLEFAKALSISAGYVSEIEQGNKTPGSEVLISLKRVFNISADWLLTGEGEMYRQGERAPVDIKDIPLYNMKAWLEDYWKTAGEDEKAWLKVHFKKCFPDFEPWLLKKEHGAEDAPPQTALKAG